jgi:hypothetical protein
MKTLAIYLDSVLKKKYSNPGADIITVLAGLDDVDAIFEDFVHILDEVVRKGRTGA